MGVAPPAPPRGDDPLGLAALPLVDDRVRLRLPRAEDAGAIVTVCDAPDVARFTATVPAPYRAADAILWLARVAVEAEQGRALSTVIEDAASGRVVGVASIFAIGGGEAELGYIVAPAARGAGAATRAVRLLAAHAHGTLGVHRVRLRTLEENAPSQLVAIRGGFRREGVLRGCAFRGGVREIVLWARTADDPALPGDPLGTAHLPLTDGTVALRLPRLADVPAITRACDDPEIARWTDVPSPYRPEHAEAFAVMAAEGATTGRDLVLAIVDARDDRLLGAIGLHGVAGDEAVVGYWVAADARGRGVAGRALRLLVAHAHDALGLRRLELEVFEGNDASAHVARRAGFLPEGRVRARRHREGPIDRHLFARLVSDPRPGD